MVSGIGGAHQGAHGAVQSMPVVPSELGVGTLERGVTVSLGLLDTVQGRTLAIETSGIESLDAVDVQHCTSGSKR